MGLLRSVLRAVLLTCLLAGSSAWADDAAEMRAFDARVQAATHAEALAPYRTYQTAMFKAIDVDLAGAFSRCATQTANADSRPFALVADLDAAARPRNIAVRPETNVALCLKAAFVKFPFPKHPPKINGRNGLPILLTLSIAH